MSFMFPGLQGALRAFTRTSSTEELPDPVDVCGDGHLKEFETALDLVRAEVTKSALGEVPDDVWLRQCLRVSNLDARRAAKVALGMQGGGTHPTTGGLCSNIRPPKFGGSREFFFRYSPPQSPNRPKTDPQCNDQRNFWQLLATFCLYSCS